MAKPTIIFFGNERLATGVTTSCATLKKLSEAKFDVKAVITNFEKGLSRNARELEIAETADNLGIPVYYPKSKDELKTIVSKINADIGVLVAFGQIIPENIIEHFPFKIINIHPSLLPLHRGPTPIESVILNNESETGVSIMQLSARMDAGPVFLQQKISITRAETKQELADTLLKTGSDLLLKVLSDIEHSKSEPQLEATATYDNLITKQNGTIDWSKSAEVIEHEIRAYSGWPQSKTNLNGIELTVLEARVIDKSGKAGDYDVSKNELTVYCGENALSLDEVKPAGKNAMPISAFLAGYSSKLTK